MYDDFKVYDVHAHVSVPPVANLFLQSMLATNTAMASPFSGGPGFPIVHANPVRVLSAFEKA